MNLRCELVQKILPVRYEYYKNFIEEKMKYNQYLRIALKVLNFSSSKLMIVIDDYSFDVIWYPKLVLHLSYNFSIQFILSVTLQ